MNIDTLTYLVCLFGLYFYLNWRGSVAFLWACLFVLFQWVLFDVLHLDANIASLVSGLSLVLTFEIGGRFWEDPFSEAHTIKAVNLILSFVAKLLGFIGIKPESTLFDYRDSAPVQEVIRYLQASNWQELQAALIKMDSSTRHNVIQALVEVKGRSAAYDKWLTAFPESSIANIVSGFQFIHWAWEARGGGLASTVTEKGIGLFYERLQMAKENFEIAIKLENKYADPFIGLITIVMGTGFERERLWDYFAKSVVHNNDHYQAHVSMINALAEKWGGNEGEMFSVATQGAYNAENNTALTAVIAEAHIEKWLFLTMCDLDEDAEIYFRDKGVREKLMEAYDRIKDCDLNNFDNIMALNSLAFCFYLSGLNAQAKAVMSSLHGRFVEYPWVYLDEPFMASLNVSYAIDHVLKKLHVVKSDLPDAQAGASSVENKQSSMQNNNNQKKSQTSLVTRRVFKAPIIVPLSVMMVILIFAGYPLLTILNTDIKIFDSFKSISFEIFVLCDIGLISLILTGKKHLTQFLEVYPVVCSMQAIDALKPVARTNMYSALIGFFFIALGSLSAIMTIVNFGLVKSVIVVVLSVFGAIMMTNYSKLEEKVKQIECVDEELEIELNAILDCWMHKALPDF